MLLSMCDSSMHSLLISVVLSQVSVAYMKLVRDLTTSVDKIHSISNIVFHGSLLSFSWVMELCRIMTKQPANSIDISKATGVKMISVARVLANPAKMA